MIVGVRLNKDMEATFLNINLNIKNLIGVKKQFIWSKLKYIYNIYMSCENITEIINNVKNNCDYETAIEIEESCPIICLTSMLFMYNNCLLFLAQNKLYFIKFVNN